MFEVLLKTLGIHRWTVVCDTGKRRYEECACCVPPLRRAVELSGGYQPLDREWLAGAQRKPCQGQTAPPPGPDECLIPSGAMIREIGSTVTDKVIAAIRQRSTQIDRERFQDIAVKVQDAKPVLVEITTKHKPTA